MTLARALYSKAQVLLLDDVLAALDVHTARWVVEKAFEGDLIKDRTILLVTHNIALAAPIAENVVVLGRNGMVTSHGTVADVLKNDARLRRQAEDRSKIEDVEADIDNKEAKADDGKSKSKDAEDKDKQSKGKLVVAEEKAIGRVKWAALKIFVDGVGGPWMWAFILFTYFFSEVVNIYQRAIMGYWTSQYDTHPASEVPVLLCVSIYPYFPYPLKIVSFFLIAIWDYTLREVFWSF